MIAAGVCFRVLPRSPAVLMVAQTPRLGLQVLGCHHLSLAHAPSSGNVAPPLAVTVLDTFAGTTSIVDLTEADGH
jgi:hypothetical protein